MSVWNTGKPRVIRRANRKNAKGQFVWAIDYRLGARMQRVVARDTRWCAAERQCAMGETGLIFAKQAYAKVHANEGQGKRIRGRMIYSPRDYHFECVPEAYRPLVRFLKPDQPVMPYDGTRNQKGFQKP